jgi:hypothetical protein
MESFERILVELAKRPYACKVYGHFSHACFCIGTAPNYEASLTGEHHKFLVIEPLGDRFRVGYGRSPLSKWGRRLVAGTLEEWGCWEVCAEDEVLPLVDRVVTRDLDALSLSPPP